MITQRALHDVRFSDHDRTARGRQEVTSAACALGAGLTGVRAASKVTSLLERGHDWVTAGQTGSGHERVGAGDGRQRGADHSDHTSGSQTAARKPRSTPLQSAR